MSEYVAPVEMLALEMKDRLADKDRQLAAVRAELAHERKMVADKRRRSGCMCDLGEDGEAIVAMCDLHRAERDTAYAKGMTEGIKGGRIQMREEAARACEDRGTSYQLSKAPGWQEVVHESDQCAAAIRNLP